MIHNILERIAAITPELTHKQTILANYITENYQKAAFLNSTDLAKAAGVSGSTVIRFAELLDYSGFPEMHTALHSMVQLELNTRDMFSEPYEKSEPDSLENIFKAGAEHIAAALRSISKTKFNQCIDFINKRQKILIVGHQMSACCAEYLYYALGRVRPDVFRITKLESASYNLLNSMTSADVAIVYAFPRFPHLTRQIMALLHERNIPIIYVTESGDNPLAEFATLRLSMHTHFASYVDDIAPAMTLSRAIIIALANYNPELTSTQLDNYEEYVTKCHIFCKTSEL